MCGQVGLAIVSEVSGHLEKNPPEYVRYTSTWTY